MRGGGSKDGHHGVADELLDGAPVTLELGAHAGVVGLEEPPHVLGVHALRARGEADEVAEEQVTTLRSSRGDVLASSDVAHHEQKRASSALSRPQLGQIFTRRG